MDSIRYFDYAATTPVEENVLKKMLPYFSLEFGNPSAIYSIGRRNKKAIEEAREKISRVLNADDPREIFFTSGGSESDNLAIKGIAFANKERGNHIITTKIEHHAVLNTCAFLEKEGFRVTYLDVDSDGVINLEELENAITKDTILITVMFANNEIGTIEPISEIGKIGKKHNVIFHTDAVQAIGNLEVDVQDMNIDALSMSAHKFYGPKGVGALYVRKDINFLKLQDGGHQEMDKRAGTENVAGIVGLGGAIVEAYRDLDTKNNKLIELRDYYIARIEKEFSNAKLNGHREKRLPGNANFSFEGVNGEELLAYLDYKGICASTGSACSSGSSKPSHVLLALGLQDKLAQGSLRVTIGKYTRKEDIDYLLEIMKEIINRK